MVRALRGPLSPSSGREHELLSLWGRERAARLSCFIDLEAAFCVELCCAACKRVGVDWIGTVNDG